MVRLPIFICGRIGSVDCVVGCHYVHLLGSGDWRKWVVLHRSGRLCPLAIDVLMAGAGPVSARITYVRELTSRRVMRTSQVTWLRNAVEFWFNV